MSTFFGNRCYGCDHYEGWRGSLNDGPRTSVNCGIGQRAWIGSGCSQFTPDVTATCYGCINHIRNADFSSCSQGINNRLDSVENCSYFYHKESYPDKEESGGCFISTVVCDYFEKPDDCSELLVLRDFRDSFLMGNEKYKSMVLDYYSISPKLVSKLKTFATHDDFEKIHEQYIKKCCDLIKEKEMIAAINLYKAMLAYINNLTYLQASRYTQVLR